MRPSPETTVVPAEPVATTVPPASPGEPASPAGPEPSRARVLLRRSAKIAGVGALGYLGLWLTSVLGMLGAHAWAMQHEPTGEKVAGISHFMAVDDTLWRGSAPGPAGYRELADRGVTTVVDLRAEDLTAHQLGLPGEAGLDLVRLPIRDGQTPTPEQVDRLVEIVRSADGPVFVHCGAGVGRTGSITSAYLLATGQADNREALVRTLAAGPPSVEQVYYVLTADRDDAGRPPAAVQAVSRLLDAPRRINATLDVF